MTALRRFVRRLLPMLAFLVGALLVGQWQAQTHALEHHATGDDDGHAVLCLHCLTLAAVQVLPPPLTLPGWSALAAPALVVIDAVPMGLTFAPLHRPPTRAPPTALSA